MKSEYQTHSAFTLIELLIVAAIIGILAAIAIPSFLQASVRANLARAQSEQKTLADALDLYFSERGSYPPARADSANAYGGYKYLTTPIPYLHSSLIDPFQVKHLTLSQRGNDYDQHYEFMVSSLQEDQYTMFNIECVGPDGIDSFKPTPIYPLHPEEFQFYEPTNGLRSYGDILRAGGATLPRWYIERRGGRETAGRDWL